MPPKFNTSNETVVAVSKCSTESFSTGWARDDQIAVLASEQCHISVTGHDVRRACNIRTDGAGGACLPLKLWVREYTIDTLAGSGHLRRAFCINPHYPGPYDESRAITPCKCRGTGHSWSCANWRVPSIPSASELFPALPDGEGQMTTRGREAEVAKVAQARGFGESDDSDWLGSAQSSDDEPSSDGDGDGDEVGSLLVDMQRTPAELLVEYVGPVEVGEYSQELWPGLGLPLGKRGAAGRGGGGGRHRLRQ